MSAPGYQIYTRGSVVDNTTQLGALNSQYLRAGVKSAFIQLRESAIVASGQATWLQGTSGGAVLGPSLYNGTAGVAWSLCEYAHVSGETWAAELAKKAIIHALAHRFTISTDQRLGFYGGWMGVAFAAGRVAYVLEDANLSNHVESLLGTLSGQQAVAEFDLISGNAGAVLAGSLLAPIYGSAALTVALTAATHLQKCAESKIRSGRRVAAWRAPRTRRVLPLTGLAHGTAGVAWALLELWARVPGETWLKDLADEAFRYENDLFDVHRQNWPDLRHYHSWRATRLLPPPFQAAWCHGAGGIAVSRIRALAITGDIKYGDEISAAVNTLRRSLAVTPGQMGPNLELCHGLAGTADVLRSIESWPSESPSVEPDINNIACAVAKHLTTAHAAKAPPYENPGLMQGTAGLGLFLLRATGSSSTSALIPDSISTERRPTPEATTARR